MKLLHVDGSEAAAKSFANLARAQSNINWQIHRVKDAYEGIDYLSGFADFADRTYFPFPQVILLMLNAKTPNGLDLLAWLRGEGRFPRLPIVVAKAPDGSSAQVSAHKLAPRAWFVETSDRHAALSLCEDLALNTCTQFSPRKASTAWPFPISARAGDRSKWFDISSPTHNVSRLQQRQRLPEAAKTDKACSMS